MDNFKFKDFLISEQKRNEAYLRGNIGIEVFVDVSDLESSDEIKELRESTDMSLDEKITEAKEILESFVVSTKVREITNFIKDRELGITLSNPNLKIITDGFEWEEFFGGE